MRSAFAHGTHVASVIFGQHGSPVLGIAPRCRGLIVPIYSAGVDGSLLPCTQQDLAEGIAEAVRRGAHVINVSGGEPAAAGSAEISLANVVRDVAGRALIVAAAGNDGCACLHVPGALPGVLVVGAMDGRGDPLAFSNWGSIYQNQGVLAPGEGVLGADTDGGTVRRSGTSYATPIVSGVAALLMSLQLRFSGAPGPARRQGGHPAERARV